LAAELQQLLLSKNNLFRSFELISQDTHPETCIRVVDQSDSKLSALDDLLNFKERHALIYA